MYECVSHVKDFQKKKKDFQKAAVCSLVQFNLSVVSDSATPWTAAHHASLSITNDIETFVLWHLTQTYLL